MGDYSKVKKGEVPGKTKVTFYCDNEDIIGLSRIRKDKIASTKSQFINKWIKIGLKEERKAKKSKK